MGVADFRLGMEIPGTVRRWRMRDLRPERIFQEIDQLNFRVEIRS
jgi:hypothetical protein